MCFPLKSTSSNPCRTCKYLAIEPDGLGVATTPYLALDIPPHPIPSHLIYLTLYKAHTIGWNICSRHKAVLIFLWLIYQLIIIDLVNVGVVVGVM